VAGNLRNAGGGDEGRKPAGQIAAKKHKRRKKISAFALFLFRVFVTFAAILVILANSAIDNFPR